MPIPYSSTSCVRALRHVSPLLLVGPALGDLDLAVAAAGAVADHEVVAAAVESQDLAVLAVDLVVVAAGRRTVMEDDVPPGPVGLVGIQELIGARFINKRTEPVVQAGAADARGSRRTGLDAILRPGVPC